MTEMQKQAIPGVAPTKFGEVAVMTEWPTIASTELGRMLGRMYVRDTHSALGNLLTLRNFVVLFTIPLAMKLWVWTVLPFRCLRYRLTNRRIIIQRGYTSVDVTSIALDQFDAIEIEQLPGQGWFNAGDLVFKRGKIETFRLAGVSRPETFRHTCLKAHFSHVGVKKALERQAAMV